MNDALKMYVQSDGTLSACAWPGGYPLFYIDTCSNVLCPSCASRETDPSQEPIAADINWEDAHDCGKRIESAYAE